jgi:type II secretory pathway pseudopilin PulG
MKILLRLLLKTQHRQNNSGQAQKEKGMTLIELLIGMVMAFLIITPMLAFVVDMLNTDRREQVKANTEQDIQAAVDFIAQDLSQAIYIYNRAGIDAINASTNKLPAAGDPNKIPILVFWKRQQMKDSVPMNPSVTVEPKDCNEPPNQNQCNDTYVLSLVAYYQFKDNDPTWCQPAGGKCPNRIVRYEIKDGIKNPSDLSYYTDAQTDLSQRKDPAFNDQFNFNRPTENVTAGLATNQEVLLNYIDHSPLPAAQTPPTGAQCQTLLGVTPPTGTAAFNPDDLLLTDGSTHSFYACVDSARNLARVTIRGNSLRRIQTDAVYNANSTAFFPTATVQVQGLGVVGK